MTLNDAFMGVGPAFTVAWWCWKRCDTSCDVVVSAFMVLPLQHRNSSFFLHYHAHRSHPKAEVQTGQLSLQICWYIAAHRHVSWIIPTSGQFSWWWQLPLPLPSTSTLDPRPWCSRPHLHFCPIRLLRYVITRICFSFADRFWPQRCSLARTHVLTHTHNAHAHALDTYAHASKTLGPLPSSGYTAFPFAIDFAFTNFVFVFATLIFSTVCACPCSESGLTELCCIPFGSGGCWGSDASLYLCASLKQMRLKYLD